MNIRFWLDVSLVFLGLFALFPQMWLWFRRPQAVHPPSQHRPLLLLLYLGIVILTLVSVDVGAVAWQRAYPSGNVEHGETRTDLFPPGTEAPDFSLPTVEDDRIVSLGEFRGHKPVVLTFGSFS